MRRGIQFLIFLSVIGCAHRQEKLANVASGIDKAAFVLSQWPIASQAALILSGAIRLTAEALAVFWPEKETDDAR